MKMEEESPDSKKQMTEVAQKISKTQDLELTYGVHIDKDSVNFATELLAECQENLKLLEDMDVVQLVESACQRLSVNNDSDSEEINLDWDEYYLDRAFCEAIELRKEKSFACRSIILPRVEKELAEFTTKWKVFKSKWGSAVEQMRDKSEKRVDLLKKLHHAVTILMERIKSGGNGEANDLVQLLPGLRMTSTQLQDTIPSAFKERRYVGRFDIAQVASSKTGLPLKYFQSPFKLRTTLKNLKSRLSEKLIGLDDVIFKITSAFSKQESSTGPFGSFFFLGCHGCGRTKLAKALAEEFFDDKNRLIKLDMSQYQDPDCLSRLIAIFDRDKRSGKVVMFDNIENAHSCCNEVLIKILKDGILTDEKGLHINFSCDILIVSSHIGHERLTYCRCLHNTMPKIPFQTILKEPTLLHPGMHLDPKKVFNGCDLHPFYVKVAECFKVEFMDLFDSVVVFPRLRPLDYLVISWLQVRDTAICMSTSSKMPIILYPSDAALNNMTSCPNIFDIGAHAYETWYEVHRVHMLNSDILKNEADKKIIIYIDALLGCWKEYSFRVETIGHLEKHLEFKSSKESLWHLRSKYRQEKQQVNKIYKLLSSYSRLVELIHMKSEIDVACVRMVSEEVVGLIDDVVKSETMQVDDFVEKCSLSEKTTQRSNDWLKLVSSRLQISLELQDKATQVTIEALLRQLNTYESRKSGHPPLSFLCLGLTPHSLEQFTLSLQQHLVIDDREKLLIQVDLSACTEPESFFWCTDNANTDMLLTELVKKTPLSVIIFYELEKAHISVFSTILSILEDGVSKDKDGNIVDFSNSVIIIVSRLGDQEMIGGFNGHPSKIVLRANRTLMKSTFEAMEVVGSSLLDEKGLRGLRSELLNRLDHMLLFDPFSGDQLNAFVKLQMKYLWEKSFRSLSLAFSNLFNVQGNMKSNVLCYNTRYLLDSIEDAGGKDVIVRYGSRDIRRLEVVIASDAT